MAEPAAAPVKGPKEAKPSQDCQEPIQSNGHQPNGPQSAPAPSKSTGAITIVDRQPGKKKNIERVEPKDSKVPEDPKRESDSSEDESTDESDDEQNATENGTEKFEEHYNDKENLENHPGVNTVKDRDSKQPRFKLVKLTKKYTKDRWKIWDRENLGPGESIQNADDEKIDQIRKIRVIRTETPNPNMANAKSLPEIKKQNDKIMASVVTLMKGFVKVAEAIKPVSEANSISEFPTENPENADVAKISSNHEAVIKNGPIGVENGLVGVNPDPQNPVKALRLNMEKTGKENHPLDLSQVTPSPNEFEGQSTEGRIGQCMDIVKKSVIDLVRDALEKERLEMNRLRQENLDLREEIEIFRKISSNEQVKKVELELQARRKVLPRDSVSFSRDTNFQQSRDSKKIPVERRNGPLPTNQKPQNVQPSPKLTTSEPQMDKPNMPPNRVAKSQPNFQHQTPGHRLPAGNQDQIRPAAFSVQQTSQPGYFDTRPTNYHAPVSTFQPVPRIPPTYVVQNGHQTGYHGNPAVKQYENPPVNSRVQPVNPNRQASQPNQAQPAPAHPHSTYSSRPRNCQHYTPYDAPPTGSSNNAAHIQQHMTYNAFNAAQ